MATYQLEDGASDLKDWVEVVLSGDGVADSDAQGTIELLYSKVRGRDAAGTPQGRASGLGEN